MPKSLRSSENIKSFEGKMKALDGKDHEPPSLEVIVTYLVGRAYEEGKTKDDIILMVRKSWDDNVG